MRANSFVGRQQGALLDDFWQADAAIRDSDQGRSFEAFSAFLLSIRNREELSEHLASVLKLPAYVMKRGARAWTACTPIE